MEKLGWLILAGVAAVVPPVRQRVVPVGKAVVQGGLGVAGAVLAGLKNVATVAIQGASEPSEAAKPKVSGASNTTKRTRSVAAQKA